MSEGRRQYKVIEKSGGIGEVVQIMMHDVGVNTGDNLPPLLITPARVHGALYASPRSVGNQGGGGLIAAPMKSSCSACASHQQRIEILEAQIDYLVHQMQVDNLLNALLAKLRQRDDLVASSSLTKARRTQQRQPKELMDFVEGELVREGLLHALMDLLARPTKVEESAFFDKNTSATLRSLKKEIQLPPKRRAGM